MARAQKAGTVSRGVVVGEIITPFSYQNLPDGLVRDMRDVAAKAPLAVAVWRDHLEQLAALPGWPLLQRVIPDADDGATLQQRAGAAGGRGAWVGGQISTTARSPGRCGSHVYVAAEIRKLFSARHEVRCVTI